ncbi:MAG TPA: DNA polymerase III subunit gamma/tau, partial [Pyrinomonadaceae bacterium]|nr:DNA polymerase III subunit gamma/tau [Pyrinomonadaceae bacterium]
LYAFGVILYSLRKMSYQVIARKWRPQAFDEVTGQEHITQTLLNAIEHERLHHAYLFSGARGVGKTTTARLLAKALNCHKTDKPNLNPCRSDDQTACASCQEISESRSIDVLEFDAASHTGVDDIRDIIIENINVAPARDRFKVFIIDEVHMLSNSSFNALLKTVEEPPPNVVFIMATTELHKVPATILSRCQEFEFRTIPLQRIFERLKLIATAEKVDVEDAALREIARSGEGSMRDAQSNFDQVISFSGEKIGVAEVATSLGLASTEMLGRVLQAVLDKESRPVLVVVGELISRGQDLRNFSRDLLATLRDLMVFKVSGGDVSLIEGSVFRGDELAKFSADLSESDILRMFNSLAETETQLKAATQSRYVLEIGLVKLVEMRRLASIDNIIERLAALENASPSAVAASATAEKKTLISESRPPVGLMPETKPPVIPIIESDPEEEESPFSFEDEPERGNPRNGVATIDSIDLSFVESMPVRLPPISSEDLEHVENDWLDNAYEAKLERSGDDLVPIPDAPKLAASLFGSSSKAVSANANGSVAVPAIDISVYTAPVFDEAPADAIAPLPTDPTKEELFQYAQSHPLARQAMRILKAKIVDVKQRS